MAAEKADYGWALPEEIVFPKSPFPLRVHLAKHGHAATLTLREPASWARFANLFVDQESSDQDLEDSVASMLVEGGFLEAAIGTFGARQSVQPGIYRLQHAAALIVGKESRILVDPVHFIARNDILRPETIGSVDAILLSHGHNDHVCPLSLVHYGRSTPILLYESMGGSMLCSDLAAILRAAGFLDVRTLSPGDSARFGDIVVTARSFLGEQPWLAQPAPDPRLRVHGRTWLVEIGACRIWFLVDSGFEYGASMLDEAARVFAEHGPVDVVVSNLRSFPWFPEQIDGSGRYLFCFPIPALFKPSEWPVGQMMTLGPKGVGEIALAVGARSVLPHAHWFHQPGASILIDKNTSEQLTLAEVRRAAGERLATFDWRVGDAFFTLPDGSFGVSRNAFN